jgi:type IV pilus assembly protein PilA
MIQVSSCAMSIHAFFRQQKETTPMLQALRRRLERDEEGFTLIELMVVVLIIAILLAIAIPTFLGARTRAQDRAAQSNLRNGLTGEKTYYTDNQQYGTAVAGTAVTALQGIEPAIRWTDTIATGTGAVGLVGVAAVHSNDSSALILDNLTLGAKSASGTCFYLMDEAETNVPPANIAPGTWYYVSNNCTAPVGGPAGGVAPTVKASDGVWGTSF